MQSGISKPVVMMKIMGYHTEYTIMMGIVIENDAEKVVMMENNGTPSTRSRNYKDNS